MRGYILIDIPDQPASPTVHLQDGGQPFSYAELLSFIQKAQAMIIEMMQQQEAKANEGAPDCRIGRGDG